MGASEGAGGLAARLFARIGLPRRELVAWAWYDWANSAFFTVVVTAIFPVYYRTVAAAGRDDVLETYGTVSSFAMLAVALLGPLLGALADASARKKRFLGLFLALGVSSTAALSAVGEGDWRLACALFALGNVGIAGGFVFYDALLPAIAREDELDRVSTAAYALGYLGGGLLLALDVALVLQPRWFGLPEGTLPARLAFVSVSVWWLLFSIPLFARVPEPPRRFERDESASQAPLRTALTRLRETFGELRRYRAAFLLLVAMLVYGDGISTVIRMAVIYGGEIGIGNDEMILAVLVVQFVGVPCAFAFGRLAGRIGAKRAILCGLAVYFGVTALAWRMSSEAEFYALATLVGVVQGGCQALSRSLFASLIPRHKSGEFFGLFGVLERFSNVFGPQAFAAAVALTGNARAGVLPLFAFFGVGALLLSRVDVDAGRRAARAAEAALRDAT
jgi:UMF1 family MFS transporter